MSFIFFPYLCSGSVFSSKKTETYNFVLLIYLSEIYVVFCFRQVFQVLNFHQYDERFNILGLVDKTALGFLDVAARPIFAPFLKALPGFFLTFVANF